MDLNLAAIAKGARDINCRNTISCGESKFEMFLQDRINVNKCHWRDNNGGWE